MDGHDVDIRDAFFDTLYEIGSRDRNVILITADADAFGLRRFKKDFPDQFINVGVAEQNMVAVAAGLALSGKKVFVYAIIPFLTMRCFEHIKVNICSMRLPVTLVGAGSGLSFNYDGPTHHAVQDIALMRILPEITILNPCDAVSAAACAGEASQSSGPIYVRIDKGIQPRIYSNPPDFASGWTLLRKGEDICLVSTGIMVGRTLEVADELERRNIQAAVIDVFRLKPFDRLRLWEVLKAYRMVISIEENSICGGLGTMVAEVLANTASVVQCIALPDEQCFQYGTRDWLHEQYGIDKTNLALRVMRFVEGSINGDNKDRT